MIYINYHSGWKEYFVSAGPWPDIEVSDVVEFVGDVLAGRDSSFIIDKSAKDALEDGSLWDDSPEVQEILEALHEKYHELNI